MNTIGPKELSNLPFQCADGAPEIPFSENTLKAHSSTHVLIFTPSTYADGTPITLVSLREKFGVDPETSEPCMYDQDWYLKEEFANRSLDGRWHLIRKNVLEDMRGKEPKNIEKTFSGEGFPNAATATFAFFAWWFHAGGERLWEHDFLWCSDTDHNGDHIYVGRYEDSTGVNKNGFNIHRHLALRSSYSAAPEIQG